MPRWPRPKRPIGGPDSTFVHGAGRPVATRDASSLPELCANGRTIASAQMPQIDRRKLLKAAAAALSAIGAALPARAHAPPTGELNFSTAEIAPGVFVHRGRYALYSRTNAGDIANCGFIVGEDAVAVIDTGGTFRVGKSLADAVASQTRKPVGYVVNTHMHPDHVFGNAAFEAAEPEFVAHHKMARGLTARAERYLAINRELTGDDAFANTRIVLPTMHIEDRQIIDLGNRRLVLVPRDTAHTDNDLTVLDETTGILFTGDLVFSGHTPSLDGSILGWRAVLDEIASENPAAIVPGHGPARMTTAEALGPMRTYLDTIITQVRAAIAKGLPISRAVETVGRELEDDWELFSHYHGRNVSAAYAELEWE